MWRPVPTSLCEVCRRWAVGRVCSACTSRHAPPACRCARCALRTGAAVGACGDCLREMPPFERTRCAVDYAFPWDRLLAEVKFHGQPELARPLAKLLAAAVRVEGGSADVVVPVPLSSARLVARGYNQAWELARHAAAELGLPARAQGLLRVIDTSQQTALTRAERLANLRTAFTVPPREAVHLRGRRVALVDDVMTTGATGRHAAQALLRAGAAAVELWVVARTPAS